MPFKRCVSHAMIGPKSLTARDPNLNHECFFWRLARSRQSSNGSSSGQRGPRDIRSANTPLTRCHSWILLRRTSRGMPKDHRMDVCFGQLPGQGRTEIKTTIPTPASCSEEQREQPRCLERTIAHWNAVLYFFRLAMDLGLRGTTHSILSTQRSSRAPIGAWIPTR